MAKLKNWYGSTYTDPVSGMQSTIYPPSIYRPRFTIDDQNVINLKNANNTARNMGQGLGNLGNWFNTNFGWNKDSGLKLFGKNVGKYATTANALMQGIDAIGNVNDLSDANQDTDALISDILRSSASNPLTSNYLTSDQQSMLNKIKRGTYDTDAGFFDTNLATLLGGAGQGALSGGLIGGIPGAIVGGLGGLLNSGLQGQATAQNLTNSELEGLLQALTDAEMQYKTMKRPNFTGLGIQQRYKNIYE